ncbi:MAG: chaperonin GroEL [Actinomycetota bacterium]
MASYTSLLFRDDARAKLLAGAEALADAVRPTLGPESRSVLIDKKFGDPIVCDDGVTIARQLTMRDPEENLGVEMLRKASITTNDEVGDGTTTSTLLAHAILKEGLRNVVAGSSAVAIRRGLDTATQTVVDELRRLARPVKGTKDTADVATVSAHNDPAVGQMVADAVDRVGSDGIVEVEQARGMETELDVVEGFQIDKGYLSAYFATEPESMEAELEDPLVLVFEKKITTIASIVPLLEQVMQAGRALVIVAETVEGEALATLVINKARGAVRVVAVKAPGFGDRRKEMLRDLAILTGGRVISEETGDKLENVSIDDLGSAAKVVVDRDETIVIGGGGDPAAVRGRQDELRRQIADTTSDWDREKLEERLAKLTGQVAVIRVGAPTEVELERLKEAYDDAINSTRAAIEEGIVPGGGSALLRAIPTLDQLSRELDGDERIGVLVLREALAVPARQLALNVGADPGVVVDRIGQETGFFGFDARTRAYGQMDELGIIDPTKVVRTALERAVAVAGVLLLAEATMTEIEEPEPAQPFPPELH